MIRALQLWLAPVAGALLTLWAALIALAAEANAPLPRMLAARAPESGGTPSLPRSLLAIHLALLLAAGAMAAAAVAWWVRPPPLMSKDPPEPTSTPPTSWWSKPSFTCSKARSTRNEPNVCTIGRIPVNASPAPTLTSSCSRMPTLTTRSGCRRSTSPKYWPLISA